MANGSGQIARYAASLFQQLGHIIIAHSIARSGHFSQELQSAFAVLL